MDIDVQEEEAEGVHVPGVGGITGGVSTSNSAVGVQGDGEYTVPEKIKTLHQLALQYVNQVTECPESLQKIRTLCFLRKSRAKG